jgi:hypothetical protein
MIVTEGLTKDEIKELLIECHEGHLHLLYREEEDDISIRYASEVLTALLHAAAKHVELTELRNAMKPHRPFTDEEKSKWF